jgi:N-acetylglutamate synthase-like GNAT family acetyltransferase
MIREAERQDCERLAQLYKMLVPTSKRMLVLEERIDEMRKDPRNFLFVYEEEGQIQGTVSLAICMEALHGMMSFGVIENIVVDEARRGNRIGQRLVQHAEQYCRSIHCSKMMLLSNSKREQAHKYFEREGYSGSISKGFKKYLYDWEGDNQ